MGKYTTALPHFPTTVIVQEEGAEVRVEVFVLGDVIEMLLKALNELVTVPTGIINPQHLDEVASRSEVL